MSTAKRALVIGIGGQDGSYLAYHLLSRGYEVHGVHRRASYDNLRRIRDLLNSGAVTVHHGDLTDPGSLRAVMMNVMPHAVYNVADQDHIGWSWDCPRQSLDVTGRAVLDLLEIVRLNHPTARVFQPVSSTMFGNSSECPQTEQTPLKPNSPYAVAKTLAYNLCRLYRDKYGMYVSTGILYNHDSARRARGYLLDAILDEVIKAHYTPFQPKIQLLDPDAIVDIGHATEYMDAAVRLLQLPDPTDCIIASGVPRSVKDIARTAFSLLRTDADTLEITKAPSPRNQQYVGQGTALVGDPSRICSLTRWSAKTSIHDILREKLETRIL